MWRTGVGDCLWKVDSPKRMTRKDIQILKIKTLRIELPATSANTTSGILHGNFLAYDKAATIEVFLRVLNDWNDTLLHAIMSVRCCATVQWKGTGASQEGRLPTVAACPAISAWEVFDTTCMNYSMTITELLKIRTARTCCRSARTMPYARVSAGVHKYEIGIGAEI